MTFTDIDTVSYALAFAIGSTILQHGTFDYDYDRKQLAAALTDISELRRAPKGRSQQTFLDYYSDVIGRFPLSETYAARVQDMESLLNEYVGETKKHTIPLETQNAAFLALCDWGAETESLVAASGEETENVEGSVQGRKYAARSFTAQDPSSSHPSPIDGRLEAIATECGNTIAHMPKWWLGSAMTGTTSRALSSTDREDKS